jgi:hypothetical protein
MMRFVCVCVLKVFATNFSPAHCLAARFAKKRTLRATCVSCFSSRVLSWFVCSVFFVAAKSKFDGVTIPPPTLDGMRA